MLHPFTKKDSRNLASSKPSPTSPCAKRGACHRTSDTLSSMGRQWHHFLPLNHGLVEEKIYSKATDLTTFFFFECSGFRFIIFCMKQFWEWNHPLGEDGIWNLYGCWVGPGLGIMGNGWKLEEYWYTKHLLRPGNWEFGSYEFNLFLRGRRLLSTY